MIINGKNFYDGPNDSDIKTYDEIKKLTTGKGGNYTARYLLDHKSIKL